MEETIGIGKFENVPANLFADPNCRVNLNIKYSDEQIKNAFKLGCNLGVSSVCVGIIAGIAISLFSKYQNSENNKANDNE